MSNFFIIETAPSRLAQIFSICIASTFIGISWLLLTNQPDNPIVLLAGTAGILYFGFVLLLAFKQALNNKPTLVVDKSGVNDTNLGAGLIKYSDIKEVHSTRYRGLVFILLTLDNPQKYLERMNLIQKSLFEVNKLLLGSGFYLKTHALNVTPEKIIEVIEHNKEFLKK